MSRPSFHQPPSAAPHSPAAVSAARAAAQPNRAAPAPTNVLIVDGSSAVRHALGEWFERRGAFIVLAGNHEMADTALRTLNFDLIICDSGATSRAARRWVDELFAHAPSPIILTSSHPTLEAAIRVANHAIAGYLPKPIDLAALERLVTRFVPAPAAPSPRAPAR